MAKRVVEYEVDDEGNPIEPEPEQNPMEAQPPNGVAAQPQEEEQEEREDVRPHVTQRYVARQPPVEAKPKYRLRKPVAPQQPQAPKPQLSLEEQIVEVTKQENRAYYLYTQTADQEIMRIIKDLQLKKAQLLHEKRRREEEVRRSQIYGQMMYNANNVNADPYIAEMMHSRAPPAFNMPAEPQPPTPIPQMLPLDQNQFPQPMPQQMPMQQQRPQQYQYPQPQMQQQAQYPQTQQYPQQQAQYPQQYPQQQPQPQMPMQQPQVQQVQYPQQQPYPQYPNAPKKQGIVERLAPHATTVIIAGIGIAALYYLFLK